MTIDEAIKWLEQIIRNPNFAASMEGAEAIKLGLEGLKIIQLKRQFGRTPDVGLLPGEN